MRLALHSGSQPRAPLSFEDPPRHGVPEASDHDGGLWHAYNNVNRYYSGAG